jgi:hypothetical protein
MLNNDLVVCTSIMIMYCASYTGPSSFLNENMSHQISQGNVKHVTEQNDPTPLATKGHYCPSILFTFL